MGSRWEVRSNLVFFRGMLFSVPGHLGDRDVRSEFPTRRVDGLES